MNDSGPQPQERVLSTLNRDGSRRWLRPKPARGRFQQRRQVVGYLLIAVFVGLPYVRIGGKPAILLDIVRREFTLFGKTYLATDTLLLMFFLITVLVGVFLLTAIFGRVWCGWACPQTVYLELLFRPIERWIEGGRNRQLEMDRNGPDWRRILKLPVFLALSMFVAHTFLAYFVGVEQLLSWVRSSPAQHPQAFVVMALVTGAMFLDFAYFREQTCLVACPYGRLQSVLLDRHSLIVGYDVSRGEPRGRRRRGETSATGDCVDCGNCVTTCPTGIDIRDGLQMECVNCTQCIDACDAVMEKLGRPRGLIRYSSQAELAGLPRRMLRGRVVFYPLIFLAALTALIVTAASKGGMEVTILRPRGAPFQILPDGEISNSFQLKVVNRTERRDRYDLSLVDLPDGRIISAELPLEIEAGGHGTARGFIVAPRETFRTSKRRNITLRTSNREGTSMDHSFSLLGSPPEHRGESP